MISLVNEIPHFNLPRVEVVKINCNYNLYRDIALFWTQDQTRAVISLLDGDMVIFNNGADCEELREFINVISPHSVFSDADTLTQIFGNNFHTALVMQSNSAFNCDMQSDILSSNEIYKLLSVDGLDLPDYEYFAVDFCYRLNHGGLKYFAIKDLCAAIGIFDGHTALVNGIASHKKGLGTTALYGLLSQFNVPALAVCKKHVSPFYLKNNFSHAYNVGYWRKIS